MALHHVIVMDSDRLRSLIDHTALRIGIGNMERENGSAGNLVRIGDREIDRLARFSRLEMQRAGGRDGAEVVIGWGNRRVTDAPNGIIDVRRIRRIAGADDGQRDFAGVLVDGARSDHREVGRPGLEDRDRGGGGGKGNVSIPGMRNADVWIRQLHREGAGIIQKSPINGRDRDRSADRALLDGQNLIGDSREIRARLGRAVEGLVVDGHVIILRGGKNDRELRVLAFRDLGSGKNRQARQRMAIID